MKLAGFSYPFSDNLGDQIQSLAVERLVGPADLLVDREALAGFRSREPHLLVMNGWFAHDPASSLPPSASLRPVFVGFHLTRTNATRAHVAAPQVLAYVRRHAPIGCRDESTAAFLQRAGVPATVTHCLTLTLARREKPPPLGRVFVVDAPWVVLPPALAKRALYLTHCSSPVHPEQSKRRKAEDLLAAYRDEATLVVTTRIHAALPCLAMGVPVVFFGTAGDERTAVFRSLGVPVHRDPTPRFVGPPSLGPWLAWRLRAAAARLPLVSSRSAARCQREVDWEPRPVELEAHKREVRSLLAERVARASDGGEPYETE